MSYHPKNAWPVLVGVNKVILPPKLKVAEGAETVPVLAL